SLTIVCPLLLTGALTLPAQALDFSASPVVYYETYDQANPGTTPEIDSYGFGGGLAGEFVSGIFDTFDGPTISGGSAIISIVNGAPAYSQAVLFGFDNQANFASSFGLRGSFEGFFHHVNATNIAVVSVLFAGGESLTSQVFISDSDVSFGLIYSDGTTEVQQLKYLGPMASAAIKSGVPFELDVSFDRVELLARTSITPSGFGEFVTAPLDLTGVTLPGPISFFDQGGGLGAPGSLDLTMTEIEMFEGAATYVPGPVDLLDPHVSAGSALLGSSGIARIEQPRVDAIEGHTFYVPEPSALVLIAAGLPVLAMLHSTRRRGASGCKPTRTELHDSRLRDHHGGTAWIR
ncbi:MAG: hypothetical protein PVF69_14550, partial [Gemmatimonadota bacterium]